jgi:hypothetical protein
MRNLFTSNLFANLRGRINAGIGVIIATMALCVCGAVMTFVLAPQQALKAYRISQMPMMDAGFVGDSAAGSDILITGYLNGNPPTPALPDFIAYTEEKWKVTVTKDDQGKGKTPSGSWSLEQTVIPELILDTNDAAVDIHASGSANLSGPVHEKIVDGNGALQANDGDKNRKDGAIRYRGFFSGDLTTVFGKKASIGGVIPEEFFAGDRIAFEAYQKQIASSFLFMGIAFMACSPLVLAFGILAVLFGRRR